MHPLAFRLQQWVFRGISLNSYSFSFSFFSFRNVSIRRKALVEKRRRPRLMAVDFERIRSLKQPTSVDVAAVVELNVAARLLDVSPHVSPFFPTAAYSLKV